MRFRILGSLEIDAGGQPVEIPGRKPRVLMAVLIAHANRFATSDFLIDVLWEGEPPDGAGTTLRGYIAALRKALGSREGERSAEEVVRTGPGGYELVVEEGELDADEFGALVARARAERADGRREEAVATLHWALGLWRGDPLPEVSLTWLRHTFIPRLEARRLAAVAERMDLCLELGRHKEVLPDLEELVAQHPFDEGLRAQLMRALYLSGRPSDALETYRRAHDQLIEETGLTPGPDLQDIQWAVLQGRPLRIQPVSDGSEGAGCDAPCELPSVVPDFVGREDVLVTAHQYCLDEPDQGRAHAPTLAFCGPPGIGKTSVATELAHQLKGQFPDGQLWVPLGAEHGSQKMEGILRRSLEALGVDTGEIPEALPDLERLYRRITANQRLLVFLDGAPGEADVRPLLPTGPRSAVIVTTRVGLAGLGGVRRVRLRPFSAEETVEFLTGVLGERQVRDDEAAAHRLNELCDGLPLAVRAAAARIGSREGWSLRRQVARLEQDDRRLDELEAGDLCVRAALAAAVEQCAPQGRALLARVVEESRRRVSAADAADLLEVDLASAEDVLHGLYERGLLGPPVTGDEGVHPVGNLATAYARVALRDAAGGALSPAA